MTSLTNTFNFLFFLIATLPSLSVSQNPGFYVEENKIKDLCGKEVIFRGINSMTVWTDKDGKPTFSEIAKTGANVVRIVWTTTDGTPEELDRAIQECIRNQMIPMIELHDATGDISKVPKLVDWWIKPEVVSVIKKYEKFLFVNIANEAGDNNITDSVFLSVYTDALLKMRSAGIHTPLIIDASTWGQDIDILQATGPQLIEKDPNKNLLFSVHMWWPSEWRGDKVEQYVIDEIQESVDMKLPLIIGEFAQKSVDCTPEIPYLTILDEAQKQGIGWLAWSWGPGNTDCSEMDMTTDGTFNTLMGWGLEVATTHKNSIANTSVVPYFVKNGTCEPVKTKKRESKTNQSIDNKKFNVKGQPHLYNEGIYFHKSIHLN